MTKLYGDFHFDLGRDETGAACAEAFRRLDWPIERSGPGRLVAHPTGGAAAPPPEGPPPPPPPPGPPPRGAGRGPARAPAAPAPRGPRGRRPLSAPRTAAARRPPG